MMIILYALLFSFIIKNSVKKGVLILMSTIQDCVPGALRKKELIASFVEHFKEHHENTISVYFQFCIPN